MSDILIIILFILKKLLSVYKKSVVCKNTALAEETEEKLVIKS